MATITETSEVTQSGEAEKPLRTVIRTERKERIPALPKPPGWKCKAIEGFTYWKEVAKKHPDRIYGYIYRLWPIINKDPAYIAVEPACFADADLSDIQEEFFHRWGSGDYKVILNDGLAKKGICQFKVMGLRDKERPPIIDRLSQVVMTDPSNRQFLEDLRMRGVALPGEARFQEKEEEDMGQAQAMTEAVGRLTDTVDNLVDKVVEVSGRTPPAPPAPAEGKVGSVTLEIVQKATDMSNKIVDRAIDKAESMAQRQGDPIAGMKEVVGLVKDIMPKDTGLLELLRGSQQENLELRRQMYETQQAELRETRELLRQNLAAKVPGPGTPGAAVAQPAQSGLAATLKEIREIKDTLHDLFGGPAEEEGAPATSAKGGLTGFLMSNLPYILSLGTALVHNMAVAKTGQGQPMTPPAPPTTDGKPPLALPPQDQALAQYHQFLAQLKPSLLLYLSEDRSGTDYADFLMEMLGAEEGRLRYEAIREMGAQTLAQLLATYPPIWQVASQNPAKLEKFLNEFMNHDAIREEEERQEAATQQDAQRPKIIVRRSPPEPAAAASPENNPAGAPS